MPETLAPIAPAPIVTREQLDLIKRTVALGATDAELELFLFDCQRRGVHPLDRKLHFTKRGGRYTPIISIDYMRAQAAQTGEMAGSDDAVFDTNARMATVTVYRLTQGQRFAYTATARYGEYVPEPGPTGRGDSMWRKMPHVMLGKCAEALALRKAFPQQLGGLYVKEELEQARPDFTEEATAIADQYAIQAPRGGEGMAQASEPDDARDAPEVHSFSADRVARLPTGVVLITHVAHTPTRNANVTRTTLSVVGNAKWPADQTTITTINEQLASVAEGAWHSEQAVAVRTNKSKFGFELAGIEYAHERPAVIDPEAPLTHRDVPFHGADPTAGPGSRRE